MNDSAQKKQFPSPLIPLTLLLHCARKLSKECGLPTKEFLANKTNLYVLVQILSIHLPAAGSGFVLDTCAVVTFLVSPK